jgi:histidinol-phosphate aminotransferase
MSSYWSSIVHHLTPYVPGEQPKVNNLIKLNTNENPYAPSPIALRALAAEVADTLRLYPDPNAEQLKLAIADYYELSVSQVFVGNGSDEVLAHTFQALLKHEQPLLFPDISYSFYPVYCGLYDIDHQTIPLTENFEIDVEDYVLNNGGIIFPNPNAPTGRLLSLDAIEILLKNNTQSVIVVDEAYIDFGGQSASALVKHYPNLLVIQTLSKSRSLAGLRVGFALGHPELIEALERVKNSFNSYPLDRLAISGAVAALQDHDYFASTCAKIIHTRENLVQQLTNLGFEVIPSAANFVFTRHPSRDAEELAQQLRERSIIVRHFKQARIEQYLRITVGTDDENQRLCQALTEIIS